MHACVPPLILKLRGIETYGKYSIPYLAKQASKKEKHDIIPLSVLNSKTQSSEGNKKMESKVCPFDKFRYCKNKQQCKRRRHFVMECKDPSSCKIMKSCLKTHLKACKNELVKIFLVIIDLKTIAPINMKIQSQTKNKFRWQTKFTSLNILVK